ncbi:MAG: hypothetical protein N5P05_004170 (plasmid) [Chroococcopsis gigantea SAG 12.99]|jgi:hypothetical protein|nr:hypothetical protein [Chroococcopsis gigantea SAG 12.99]
MTGMIQRRIDRRIEQLGTELQQRTDLTAEWRDHTERLIVEYARLQLGLSLAERSKSKVKA